jgi:hypothetical protein
MLRRSLHSLLTCGFGWIPAFLALTGCWTALWQVPLFTQPWPFQILFAAAFGAYLLALLAIPRIQRGNERAQIGMVIGGAAILHLLLIPAPFAFSDDVFRYVWNGRVSTAGIDPYRYAPGDPALAFLRDSQIWPTVNAPEQTSPYPPLAEAAFALFYRLMPERLEAMKIGMSVANIAAIVVLVQLLQHYGKAPALALIYAWNPQTTFQTAFSGHNDALMVLTVLLALRLAETGLGAARMLGGWALGLAVLAKLLPVLALPFVLLRWGRRAVLVCCLTVGSVYAALLLRGQRVFDGFLYEAGTARFNDGIYYLFHQIGHVVQPADADAVARVLSLMSIGAVCIWLMQRRDTSVAGGLGGMLAAYLLFSPAIMSWYILWVLPFVALGVLPDPLPHDTPWPLRVFGSYWIMFSGSVILSELYFFTDRPTWIVVHVLLHMAPAALLLGAIARTRLRFVPRKQELV